MIGRHRFVKGLLIMVSLVALVLIGAACGGEEKEVIKFHDGQWETLWMHNAVAMYVVEKGYGYPVEEV